MRKLHFFQDFQFSLIFCGFEGSVLTNYLAAGALATLALGYQSNVFANQGTVETGQGACEIRHIELLERSVRGAKWSGICKKGKVSGVGALFYKNHRGLQSADWGLFVDGIASGYHLRHFPDSYSYSIVSYHQNGPSSMSTDVPLTVNTVKGIPAPNGPSVPLGEIFALQGKYKSAQSLFRNAPTGGPDTFSSNYAVNGYGSAGGRMGGADATGGVSSSTNSPDPGNSSSSSSALQHKAGGFSRPASAQNCALNDASINEAVNLQVEHARHNGGTVIDTGNARTQILEYVLAAKGGDTEHAYLIDAIKTRKLELSVDTSPAQSTYLKFKILLDRLRYERGLCLTGKGSTLSADELRVPESKLRERREQSDRMKENAKTIAQADRDIAAAAQARDAAKSLSRPAARDTGCGTDEERRIGMKGGSGQNCWAR